MGSSSTFGINYDVYLPIIGTVVIIGIILNSITLSYFLRKSQKTIWNRLFTVLNIVDLGINVSGAVIVFYLVYRFNSDVYGDYYVLIIVSQVYTFFTMCAAFLIVTLGASSIISFSDGYLSKTKGIYIAFTAFAAIQFFILILGVIGYFVMPMICIGIFYLNSVLEVIFLISVFVICMIALLKACNPPPSRVVVYGHSNNSGHLNPGETNDRAGGSDPVKVEGNEEDDMKKYNLQATIQPVTPVGPSFTEINRHTLETVTWLMALFLVFEIIGLIILILSMFEVIMWLGYREYLLHFFIFRPIRSVLNSTLFLIRERNKRNPCSACTSLALCLCVCL